MLAQGIQNCISNITVAVSQAVCDSCKVGLGGLPKCGQAFESCGTRTRLTMLQELRHNACMSTRSLCMIAQGIQSCISNISIAVSQAVCDSCKVGLSGLAV
jgi:hypothetical protein